MNIILNKVCFINFLCVPNQIILGMNIIITFSTRIICGLNKIKQIIELLYLFI